MSIHDRGFKSMSPARVKAIASLGGTAAQASGHGRRGTREEAVVQAKRGWVAMQAKKAYWARVAQKIEQ